MKVRGVNDFSPAFVHPDRFVDSLTVRTVTVTAGIVMEFQMTAVRTLGNVNTQSVRLTVHDISYSSEGKKIDFGKYIVLNSFDEEETNVNIDKRIISYEFLKDKFAILFKVFLEAMNNPQVFQYPPFT